MKLIAELLLKDETINYTQIKEIVPGRLENSLSVNIS